LGEDGTVIVDCAVYTQGERRPGRLEVMDALEAASEPDSFVWIGLYEPTPREFEAVRVELGLHELAVEDAIAAHQRPKLEEYDDDLFVVLKTARYLDASETVEYGAPWRGQRPVRRAREVRAPPRPDPVWPHGGAACSGRPGHRRLRAGDRGARQRHG
jgi:Mg2+ and Co2+ transporter CorA